MGIIKTKLDFKLSINITNPWVEREKSRFVYLKIVLANSIFFGYIDKSWQFEDGDMRRILSTYYYELDKYLETTV